MISAISIIIVKLLLLVAVVASPIIITITKLFLSIL